MTISRAKKLLNLMQGKNFKKKLLPSESLGNSKSKFNNNC